MRKNTHFSLIIIMREFLIHALIKIVHVILFEPIRNESGNIHCQNIHKKILNYQKIKINIFLSVYLINCKVNYCLFILIRVGETLLKTTCAFSSVIATLYFMELRYKFSIIFFVIIIRLFICNALALVLSCLCVYWLHWKQLNGIWSMQ